ncbi:MAG TPA: hypothetical protein VMW42_01905 [Desulfatiglandales bacterium]|nr:hypothetical protein [Desulfatiglandales bacterium]
MRTVMLEKRMKVEIAKTALRGLCDEVLSVTDKPRYNYINPLLPLRDGSVIREARSANKPPWTWC